MKSITTETRIDAPPARVFEVFTDLRRAAERIRGIEELEVLTAGPIGKGTRFRETRVMLGKKSSETMEIVDFQPGRSYAVTAQSCGARYLTTFNFEPDGGGTRVRMTFGATPVSFAAKLMVPLLGFMAKSLEKMLAADCADLKAVCEGREREPSTAL
jgi:carbon monoxide dehydrogenase subunit G